MVKHRCAVREWGFSVQDLTIRHRRNGYDWDKHGTLYTPENEVDSQRALVFLHGGPAARKLWIRLPTADRG
jgi:hypothetical protein